jgi:hypothetical protein
MNTDDHHDTGLGRALKEMATRWDSPVFDPVGIVDQSRARTRRARRDRWGIGAICAGTCAVATVLALTTTTTTTAPSARRQSPQTRAPGAAGLRDRQAMLTAAPLSKTCTPWTIEQARANSPFDVLLPHVPLANPSSLTHVWNCRSNVTEQFASGIHIEFEHNRIADPGASWRGLAASDPTEASVGSVQGQPAALIKPSATAVGSVTVVLGDTILWVVGNGRASLDDLVDIADSLTD